MFTSVGDWPESSPHAQGVASALLTEADRHIEATLPNVTSLLVVKNGRLVFERYYGGAQPDRAQDTHSVTKSVTSALIGIALERGLLKGLDEPALHFFPEYAGAVRDDRMSKVTLRHLLTMTAGFATELGNPALDDAWTESDDEIRFALSQRLASDPGTKFQYSNMGAHLLSGVLTKATNSPTLTFANRHLFNPIGVSVEHWPTDKQGVYSGAGNLHLRPRDMARFGYLYLNRGVWNGEEVLSSAWVEASTAKHPVPLLGWQGLESINHYGYLWWVMESRAYRGFFATGFGGQYIGVVPSLNLVAVMTGRTDRGGLQYHRYVLEDYVIPAAGA